MLREVQQVMQITSENSHKNGHTMNFYYPLKKAAYLNQIETTAFISLIQLHITVSPEGDLNYSVMLMCFSVLSQLLPLLHGNVNSSKVIINEFLEFCRQQTSSPTESPLNCIDSVPPR